MSVATTWSGHKSTTHIPVLTPLYGGHRESFCAPADGTYRCGSASESEFCLGFSGAEAFHCSFAREADRFIVNRLDGRVWINDLPVHGKNLLSEGDVISFGPVSFRLDFLDVPSHQLEPAKALPDTLVSRSDKIASEWYELRQKQVRLEALELTIRQRSGEIDQHSQRLSEQQREIEVTSEKNAFALAAIEQARQELLFREQRLQLRDSELAAKAESLSKQQQEHAVLTKSLAQTELRSTSPASSAVDTLSVAQLSAIAAKQEAAARERESVIQAQTELRQQEKVIAARQREMELRQQEIASRETEISSRLLELKSHLRLFRESKAATDVSPVLVSSTSYPDAAAVELQVDAIRADREILDRREAVLAASEQRLSEKLNAANLMVTTAESERHALHGANKDLLCERNALSQLRQDLASRESGIAEREVFVARQLEDMRSRFAMLDVRSAELKHHESEINSRSADIHRRVQLLKADRKTDRHSSLHPESAFVSDKSSETLTAQKQLADLQLTLLSTENNRDAMASERDSLLSAVRELQKALMDARQDVEDAHRIKGESVIVEQRLAQVQQDIEERDQRLKLHETMLLELTEELEKSRDDLLVSGSENENLREQLANRMSAADDSTAPVVFPHRDDIAKESRELDLRAELLDQREEELRERNRKTAQAEDDVDSQRRQLLEARQQLELARAEIQLAMRRQFDPNSHIGTKVTGRMTDADQSDENHPDISDARPDHRDRDLDYVDTTPDIPAATNDLRSELAGLFGLRKPLDNASPPPVPLSEFMDLSEPTGKNKAVAFHFGANDANFTVDAPRSAFVPETDSLSVREENSDDFVRDYMEQLLSRNRKSAGTVLPGELKPAEKKSAVPAAPEKAAGAKAAPKVKSFIEHYMAGNMGELYGEDAPKSVEENDTSTLAEEKAALPRQKMDLLKLKENMDSFRTLSTQSVENALASHAIKQERLGFSGRSAFAGVLLSMTLILGIANAYGAIYAPMLTWVTLTAAIGILTELYRRYTVIKVHTRSPLDLASKSKNSLDPGLSLIDSADHRTDQIDAGTPESYDHTAPDFDNSTADHPVISDTVSAS